MALNDCLRLCGGTFFILFTRAMKEHGRTTGVLSGEHKRVTNKAVDAASISERNLLKGLARIYYPSMTELAYSTEKSNATRFKQCRNITSIPFDNDLLKKRFDERIKHSYSEPLKEMESLVAAQIDAVSKGQWLVKALLELIDQDNHIEDDEPFYVGPGGKAFSKSALRSESHFCLEAFVLGVWHYCIMHIPDNTIGAPTYYVFYPSAKEGGTGGRHPFVSSIGNNPSRLIELDRCSSYLGVTQEATDRPQNAQAIDGYYSPYYHSAAVDIGAVKTILFEETINFREFYVCNGIHRRFFRHSDVLDGKLPRMFDDNPTIESVKEFGNRIIIQGIGGMGKSMLMRHFMLDGIEQYSKTGRVPIYVRLKDYASSNYEIADFIFDSIKAYFPSVDRERVNRDITNANLVLLLDGLDEISSAYRGQFETKLNRFLAVNDRLQVILSTRQFSKDTYASDFKIFGLMPLTKEKALQLVDKLPFRPHDELQKEDNQLSNYPVPNDEQGQKDLLRALMNVWMPKDLSDEFLEIQDEYLQEENKLAGITDIESLKPIDSDSRIFLWQGDMTTLKVDAITNPANSALLGCFSPLHNCADNIIHSKAGLSLRFKCNCIMRAQGHEEPTGKAKITPAYNLPCEYVIHTVGPIVQGPLNKRHEDLLASCYRSCLDIAEENGVKSIALCCISTGVFMFPNQRAAEIAVDTVKAWLAETGSQMKVVFNVYKDLDLEIYSELLQ